MRLEKVIKGNLTLSVWFYLKRGNVEQIGKKITFFNFGLTIIPDMGVIILFYLFEVLLNKKVIGMLLFFKFPIFKDSHIHYWHFDNSQLNLPSAYLVPW